MAVGARVGARLFVRETKYSEHGRNQGRITDNCPKNKEMPPAGQRKDKDIAPVLVPARPRTTHRLRARLWQAGCWIYYSFKAEPYSVSSSGIREIAVRIRWVMAAADIALWPLAPAPLCTADDDLELGATLRRGVIRRLWCGQPAGLGNGGARRWAGRLASVGKIDEF